VDSTAVDGVSLADRDGTIWVVHPPTDGHPAVVASITPEGEGATWHAHTIDGLWKIGVPASIYARQTPKGDTLYITGSGGILRVDANPNDAAIPPTEPIVHVLAQGGDDQQFQAIEGPLPYSTRKVLIRVAVPTFERRPAMEPQVLVDGIDTGWTSFDAKSERELTGLRDGTYSVHVRVLADTGAVSPEEISTFQIKPPWWRTAPVAMLFLVAVTSGIYGAYVFRIRRLRRRASELEATIASRTEELTRAIGQAERANSAKSDFIARVSHDIRNPLNGIVGISMALHDTELKSRQRELVQALEACARQLNSLIDDVLDFSQIEAGKFELKPAPCSLRDLLEGIAKSLATHASAADCDIQTRVDPGLPDFIMVDAHRLEEVLLNYVSNAIRYAPGRILLSAGQSQESPGILECSVQDWGPGFSREDGESLFTDFTRLSAGPENLAHGSGLGLSLCRRLADLMGGSVGVDAAEGSGARFFIRLPLLSAAPPADGSLRLFEVGSLLIVEDADYNAWAFAAVLSRVGVSGCDRAKDGRDAIARFEAKRHDVILLDRNLPDMDGIEVAKRMRAMEAGGTHALIVCVSAYSTTEDRDRCLEAGMDFFAGKPLTPEKLARIFSEAGLEARSSQLQEAGEAGGSGATRMLGYLAGEGGTSLSGQIERYIAILEACLVEIPISVASGDLASAKRNAHAIVGHAHLVEAAALAACARDLEDAVGEGDSPRVRALIEGLNEAAARVIANLAGEK
jgi:signal transduction histidine kinase/ActR/RegA family two-component response regulator